MPRTLELKPWKPGPGPPVKTVVHVDVIQSNDGINIALLNADGEGIGSPLRFWVGYDNKVHIAKRCLKGTRSVDLVELDVCGRPVITEIT